MKKTTELKENLKNGMYYDQLVDLYADRSKIAYQTARYIQAIESYENLFGANEVAVFSAPGRSEVGGNHTDHQHGEVLAASINLDAIAVARKTDDGMVRLVSDDYPQICIDVADLERKEEETATTAALIRGVLHGAAKRGFAVGGFEAYVTSDVLIGAGLSSSAAFETLLGTLVSEIYNDGNMDAVTNAKIGQYAENLFFGKPCGLMDQMACSVGSLVHVDFADPENPVVEKVELDLNQFGYSLCITDTKGSHADLTADYAAVPEEMKKVASFFEKEFMLEVSMKELVANMDAVRKQCGDRAVLRAIHFLNENERVRQEVAAIREERLEDFLSLVQESGHSSFEYLQNVFTTHDVQHQNISLALAMSESVLKNGAGVCRVHGGGFAGTIQAFVKNEKVQDYRILMEHIFGEGSCSLLKIRQSGGVRVLD